MNYLYVLTPQGITSKTKLTINFMKIKMKEYDELKAEIKTKAEDVTKDDLYKDTKNQQSKKIDYNLL
jgi:hypothetical protein